MACACKVSQQLDYINKKYGGKQPQNKKTNIRGNFGIIMRNFFATLFVILLTPLLIVYICIKGLTGKKIRIDKFLKKSKDV